MGQNPKDKNYLGRSSLKVPLQILGITPPSSANPTEEQRRAYEILAQQTEAERRKNRSPVTNMLLDTFSGAMDATGGFLSGLTGIGLKEGEGILNLGNTPNKPIRDARSAGVVLGEGVGSLEVPSAMPSLFAGLPFAWYKAKRLTSGKAPLLHGTPKDFDAFSNQYNNSSDLFGSMFHAAENPDYADTYAKKHMWGSSTPGGARVIPIEPQAQNVLDVIDPLSPDDLANVIANAPSSYERNAIKRAFKEYRRAAREAQENGWEFPNVGRGAREYASPESYVQTMFNEHREPLLRKTGYDAIRHIDGNQEAWATPDWTELKTPWGVDLGPDKQVKPLKIDFLAGPEGITKAPDFLKGGWRNEEFKRIILGERPTNPEEIAETRRKFREMLDNGIIDRAEYQAGKQWLGTGDTSTVEHIDTNGTNWNDFNKLTDAQATAKDYVDEIIKPGDTIEDLDYVLNMVEKQVHEWASGAFKAKVKQAAKYYLTSNPNVKINNPPNKVKEMGVTGDVSVVSPAHYDELYQDKLDIKAQKELLEKLKYEYTLSDNEVTEIKHWLDKGYDKDTAVDNVVNQFKYVDYDTPFYSNEQKPLPPAGGDGAFPWKFPSTPLGDALAGLSPAQTNYVDNLLSSGYSQDEAIEMAKSVTPEQIANFDIPVPSNVKPYVWGQDEKKIKFPVNSNSDAFGQEPTPSFINPKIIKNLGGSHGAQLVDFGVSQGAYPLVFKPQSGLPALGEQFGSKIANLLNNRTPVAEPLFNPTLGEGTVQPYRNLFNQFESLDLNKLTDPARMELAEELPVDWLIGNHDAHANQFLMPNDGGSGIIPIDKGQSFKHWNQESLDPFYHPNSVYGEQPPVYRFLAEDVDPVVMGQAAQDLIQGKTDGIMGLASGYVDERLKIDPNFNANKFLDHLMSKMENLSDDIQKYWKIAKKGGF